MKADKLTNQLGEYLALGQFMEAMLSLSITKTYPEMMRCIHNTFYCLREDTLRQLDKVKASLIHDDCKDDEGKDTA